MCGILRAVARCLDAADSRAPRGDDEPLGLPHADLKPANLVINRDGLVRVLDFGTGLTSLSGDEAVELARSAGIERYLSPGRRAGEHEGSWGDVYALSVLGIELGRGRWLRRTLDHNPDHDRHLAEVVAALPDLGFRSEADERALRALVLRMVAFDPEVRPGAVEIAQTMRTLADRAPGASLEAFAHDHARPLIEPIVAHPGLPELVFAEPVRPRSPPELPAPAASPTTGTGRLACQTAHALEESGQRCAAETRRRRAGQDLGAAPWFALAGAFALGGAGGLALMTLLAVLAWLWA